MKWLLLLVLLMPMLALGQGNTITRTGAIAPPSGAGQCAFIQFYVNSSNADLYDCQVSTWVKVGTSGGGGISGSGTANTLAKFTGSAAIGNSLATDDATTFAYSGTGGITATSDGTHAGQVGVVGNTTVPTSLGSNNFNWIGPNSASFTSWGIQMPSAENASAGIFHVGAASSHISQGTVSLIVAADMSAQYSKGSCTEVWGGSGTSFALTSGDDAISNNSCYNDSGVTRTIAAVKCRNDNASNTTTVNPTFGAAGTGTAILSGALTCGNSYAYSATGTVSNASWTTGTGITPAMSGTLTGTSIAMIIEYTF